MSYYPPPPPETPSQELHNPPPQYAYPPPLPPPGYGQPSTPYVDGPVGLGGWLILPIIGLFLTPILNAVTLMAVHLPLFLDGSWGYLTDPGSMGYHPLWAPVLIYEIVGNLFFCITPPIVLILLFMKKRIVPWLMVGYYVLNLIFLVSDTGAVYLIPAAAANGVDWSPVVRAVVVSMIWAPYFLVSKRVRNTFVN